MFRRLRERLSRTRETLAGGLDRLFSGRKEVDAVLLEELEELLITADIGVETTLFLIQALHEKLRRRELADVERLKAALQAEMVALLTAPPRRRSQRPALGGAGGGDQRRGQDHHHRQAGPPGPASGA